MKTRMSKQATVVRQRTQVTKPKVAVVRVRATSGSELQRGKASGPVVAGVVSIQNVEKSVKIVTLPESSRPESFFLDGKSSSFQA